MSLYLKNRLRIVLEGSEPDFVISGDKISGKVVLLSPIDETVERVTIQFHGRADCIVYVKDGAHGTNTKYPGRATLFEYTELLYHSHYTLRANTPYEWPFNFKFPASSEPSKEANDWPPHPSFNTRLVQALPPIYTEQYRSGLGGQGYDCDMEYKLTARLTRPGTGNPFKAYDSRGYVFETRLPYAQLAPPVSGPSPSSVYVEKQTLEIRSLLLLPENQDRPLTLREKTRSKFKTESLPSFSFDITFNTITRIRLGQPFTITINLKYLPEISSAPIVPTVSLESITTSIVASTHCRSEKRVVAHEDSCFRTLPCTSKHRKEYGEGCSDFTKRTDYTKSFTIEPLPSPFLVPSFCTFNINHHYRLKTTCVLACADKKLTAEAQHELIVQPGNLPGGILEVSAATATEQDGHLPTYQAATNTSSSAALQSLLLSLPSYESVTASSSSAAIEQPAASTMRQTTD